MDFFWYTYSSVSVDGLKLQKLLVFLFEPQECMLVLSLESFW